MGTFLLSFHLDKKTISMVYQVQILLLVHVQVVKISKIMKYPAYYIVVPGTVLQNK